MKVNSLIQQLKERGLISQTTNESELSEKLNSGPISLYCGFDPTSDSLHLGHLVPLLCLRRFQKAGHKPIILMGGATGLIGDPSFKSMERQLNIRNKIKNYIYKIYKQISLFLDFNCGINSAVIVNNYDWFKNMPVLTFLQDIGKYFSINKMISKKSVKHRLSSNDYGISFTEFSYSLLQSYDFVHLHRQNNVILQIGGSDQWSNIVSGINLIKRLYQTQVFGLTVPLITRSDGKKFGKTEEGTVWLDSKKTSPYTFYQFWINTTDADVYQFLKFFTFMDVKEIKDIQNNNRKLDAQYILAEKVTELVHSNDGLADAKRITRSLFSGILNKLNEQDLENLAKDGMPMIEIERGTDLTQALVFSKFQPSRGQARKIISARAVSINGKKQVDPKYIFSENDRLFGKYTILCHGKKNYCLLCWK